ncbi:MAG: BolA/IbaG family iron-sulfur metabolism protein [Proteobacteria bacterium]|nr:BolA/IbaG family iron-sulfur metabolism protein [Pseudomonadota bacterium]
MLRTEELEAKIKEHIQDALVEVVDSKGDGYHFHVTVTASSLAALSPVKQHQAIYRALGDTMMAKIHAISLNIKDSSD